MDFLYGALIFGVLCAAGYLALKSRRAKRARGAGSADRDDPSIQQK